MTFKLFTLLIALISVSFFNYQAIAVSNECSTQNNLAFQETELSPLQILIFDIRDAKNLIEEGDNDTAITILKSASKGVRKVEEFDKNTIKTTLKRIKKGIKLLKQDKNDEALALLQTGIDELIDAGLASPSDFE